MTQFKTIVADPPWAYPEGWGIGRIPAGSTHDGRRTALPYPSLSVSEIAALPVRGLAEDAGAHLYLWTTNRYLEASFGVMRSWGFRYGQTLVWAKTPMGSGPGGAYPVNVEFVLFGRLGTLRHLERGDSQWWNWKRTAKHSKKPDGFYDMVERVSPGPRLELFARERRLGWDAWGNECASNVGLPNTEITGQRGAGPVQ